jgi:anaerobic selenocysteine-containing dehydrogenase
VRNASGARSEPTRGFASREASEVKYRICPFCEATCGLAVEVEGRRVRGVRGDEADVFSRGHLCPKGVAIAELDADPDRLRRPLVRRGNDFAEASWEEALAVVAERLPRIQAEHGRDAVGAFVGNAAAHSLALSLYNGALVGGLRTRNFFSAGTTDQQPKQVAAAALFGTAVSIPIPDVDHTQLLWVLGANPLASNGSLMTAPGIGRRLRGIQERGGRVVVFDPRRSETAAAADEHVALRPGTDAHLLFAVANVLFAEGRVALGRLAPHVAGLAELEEALGDLTPEWASTRCGVSAETIRRLARELAAAPSAAVYGRIGTCTQSFGVLASFAVDVLNVLTGNFDRPGGALLTRPATGALHTVGPPGRGRGHKFGRFASRVRGFPEVFRELPNAVIAEEILTPGPGQIRAFVTLGGNPVLSTPAGQRLAEAFASLELLVCCDVYVNETSRFAHVIFPAPSPLEQPHYDVLLSQFAVRDVARWSPAVFPLSPGAEPEWKTLLRLGAIANGAGGVPVEALDESWARSRVERALGDPASPIRALSVEAVLEALAPRTGPERLVDFSLRAGPWGDHFGARPEGLTLAKLEAAPHGIDLGPLGSRIPDALRTPSGQIELAPPALLADLARLRAWRPPDAGALVLIGRRHVRSKNSWMHNLPRLVKGRDRCTLLIHPEDATRSGVIHNGRARVAAKGGELVAHVEVTDAMRPGVVSLPHGFGHAAPGARMGVARAHAGANSNELTSSEVLEPLSGTAILNGIPVEVTPA